MTDPSTGLNSTAFIKIIVPVRNAPTALDDYYRCTCGQACTPLALVTANDTSNNGGGVLSVTGLVGPPSPSGSAVITPAGQLTYTPPLV